MYCHSGTKKNKIYQLSGSLLLFYKDMKTAKIFVIIFISFLFVQPAAAFNKISKSDSTGTNKNILFKAIAFEAAYYTGAMLILQNTWYQGKKVVPFHFYNDNRGYMHVDKFGHAYGAYIESYIGYHVLLGSGISKSNALIFGGTLGLILQTPIEIMDGIHEGWGFSWGDMAANAMGTALFVGQELFFDEQIVRYKFSYSPSVYSKTANGYFGKTSLDKMLKDYNGHTYWFSFPANKLAGNLKIPRWLNIAAGYSANGMYGEYVNISSYNGVEIPETIRYRQYLLSLDIDWTNINTQSRFLKIVFQGLNFIKLPFPTIEYNSLGKFRAYWIYC